jgi:transcriptional regulator with XRE-family HTH domain
VASDDRDALNVAFGAAVRQLRGERSLSQEALAARADIARTYLAEVETGRRNITLLNIARIAGALDVGLGELMAVVDRHWSPSHRRGSG